MKNEKFEPIKFESWQELAKYVIDGGEVYYESKVDYEKVNVSFSDGAFSCDIEKLFLKEYKFYAKKQPTVEELIAIKPRLCWVWDHGENNKSIRVICGYNRESGYPYLSFNNVGYVNAQMLADDEIKKFLSDGE